MLSKENGVAILQRITTDKTVDHEVCQLCHLILDMMNNFK